MKMHTRKEVHFRIKKIPSEESHPVTDPLGNNSVNNTKTHKKSALKLKQIQT